MRRAWEEFFRSGTVLPNVRDPIAESWIRSRELGISPTQGVQPIEKGFERMLNSRLRQLLVKGAEPVIARLDEQSAGARLTLTLADERALSMKESPFRTIESLVNYIEVLINEAQNA